MERCLQRAWKAGNRTDTKAYDGCFYPGRRTRSFYRFMNRVGQEDHYSKQAKESRRREEAHNRAVFQRLTTPKRKPGTLERFKGFLKGLTRKGWG